MTDLFTQLKERKVFRVAAVYAVVAWLLIQVADTIAPMMNLAETAPRLVLFLLIMLFPVALFLAWAYELRPDDSDTFAEQPRAQAAAPTDRKLLYATFVLVLVVAGFQVVERFWLGPAAPVAVTRQLPDSGTANGTVLRASIELANADVDTGRMVQVSPNGDLIAFSMLQDGKTNIYLRDSERGETRLLVADAEAATDNILQFSPDGQSLLYWSNGGSNTNGLYRTPVTGGSPRLLVSPTAPFGMHWTDTGTILYATRAGIFRLPENGGEPQRIEFPQDDNTEYFYPVQVPGRDAVLAMAVNRGGFHTRGRIVALDEVTGELHTVMERGYRLALTPSGHLLFARTRELDAAPSDADLYIAPFDATTLSLSGPAIPYPYPVGAGSSYGFSQQGRFVYITDTVISLTGSQTDLLRVARDGEVEETLIANDAIAFPRLSPDGDFLALGRRDAQSYRDLWLYDLQRKTLSRLSHQLAPSDIVWNAEGNSIFFSQYRGRVWQVPADGIASPAPVTDTGPGVEHQPNSLDRRSNRLLYTEMVYPEGRGRIRSVSINEDGPSRILLTSDTASLHSATISPDGRWLAYTSDETGRDEVYVRPYPDINTGKWQVSTDGGDDAHWRADSGELIYARTGEETAIFAVAIESSEDFRAATPELLFSGDYILSFFEGEVTERQFTVSDDHETFYMLRQAVNSPDGPEQEMVEATVVENWFAEIESLASTNSQR